MPALDKPLKELLQYRGINPRPADFDKFWADALAEQQATDPCPELIPSKAIKAKNAEAFDLWFTGVGGARVYAKYLRPRDTGTAPHPAVFLFHGYSGNSGDWQDKLSYVSQGMAVAALDCRGQGGRSEDNTRCYGTTQNGHFVRGLTDVPEKLLFRQVFLDTVQLVRVVADFQEVDANRLGCQGGSQGGALAIACAALEPRIKRCASVFPFLSDFKRVWEMDLALDAYGELRTYFRHFDPLHERTEELLTKLGYIDVHHLAPRIRAEVLMGLTLMDKICPPSTQFAVYNNITSEKDCAIYPDYGHEALPGFPDRMFNFMSEL